jgi:TM2 domain-containing membrane protein YozV
LTLTEDEKRKIFEEEKPRKQMQGKSAAVSVFCSFLIPGLGDLYCGSWIKALVFFALDLLCLILMLRTMGIGSFLMVPVWVCGLISAWLSANKSG